MKRVPFLVRILDRLLLTRTRQRQPPKANVAPMSDVELARAMSELQLTFPAREKQPAIFKAQAWQIRRAVMENQHAIVRSQELIDKSLGVLRNPAPDTFLGRKNIAPFPKLDDE
jgi:hypothetical protein